ncbi:MAG: amino acid transporter [Gammaproteobacteria bacterium]|nr:amino acid transporter [Gammaproteobacteria bacterium]
MSLLIVAKGFTLGLSMIIPIGAQNAMILNQGINKNHHFAAAALCSMYDVLLIVIGVMGASVILNSSDLMFSLLSWGGIVFLITYGAIAFKNAIETVINDTEKLVTAKSFKVVVLTSLVVTFLNPHAYVDTVMILGSVAGQYPVDTKMYFMLGAILASVIWFFTLAASAAKLSNQLKKPKVKRVIDFMIALIMWVIAATLFQSWSERFYS